MNSTPKLRLACLDLDHTLLAADSNQLWMAWLLERGLVGSAEVEAHEGHVADYALGQLDFEALQRLRERIDAALPQLQGLRESFAADRLLPAIAAGAPVLVERLQREGWTTLIVSATRCALVEPVARALGIAHWLGADSNPALGRPCFGAGKVDHVAHWLARSGHAGSALDGACFYSDSHNDLPLLEAVARPVAVDPDPRLASLAAERGWPVISLR